MGVRLPIVELDPVKWERFTQNEDQLYWEGGSEAKTELKNIMWASLESNQNGREKGKYRGPLYRL